MAVQRTAPVYTQPPDYAREHGELDKYHESKPVSYTQLDVYKRQE